jgi:hypothetical protein
MDIDRIQNFTGTRIAFFRPRKRVYFMLEWNQTARNWQRSMTDFPNLTLHRSRQQEPARCTLTIRANGQTVLEKWCQALGYYLMSGTTVIAIVSLLGGADGKWPAGFNYPREFTCADTAPLNYERDHILWTVRAPVMPPLLMPVVVPAATHTEPIPRRIAWLVAEDASKTESCPVCMENLSPITASVTTCFHTYHTDCINEWFARNQATAPCPVCRKACVVTKAYDEILNT